jgi:Ca-activated chloride channel family protein
MEGNGVRDVKSAMELLLDQEKARPFLLQGSSEDIVTVIPFNGKIIDVWSARVGDQAALSHLRKRIAALDPGDGTDIYSPVVRGLAELQRFRTADFSSAIILMTDGKSNRGRAFEDVEKAWHGAGLDVPVHAIMFGDASEEQLGQLAELTRGRVFDGRKDLVAVFRKVRAYN